MTYKLVESRHVQDQWYIYRGWWFFWRLLSVRSGFERAVEHLRQIRSRGQPGDRELT